MANVKSSGGMSVESEGKTSLTNASSSVSERDVFVDLLALQGWSSQLKNLNEESISQLGLLISTVEGLRDSWEGNFATGFIDDCSMILNDLQKQHNNMNNLSNLLIEVANLESDL